MSSTRTGEHEVDLSQLFSDVSRTVSGLRNILARPSGQQQLSGGSIADGTSDDILHQMPAGTPGNENSAASPFAGLFGGSGVCFKTCGMEDIQFAARRAGEMFLTMKWCLIVLTVVAVLSVLALTAVVIFYLYRSGRFWDKEHGVSTAPLFPTFVNARREQNADNSERIKTRNDRGAD